MVGRLVVDAAIRAATLSRMLSLRAPHATHGLVDRGLKSMFTKRHLVELIFLHVATLYSSNHLEAHGKLFRFVHQRLHEIKHVFNKAFGRVNILACGDLSQLQSSLRLLGWLFGRRMWFVGWLVFVGW